MSVTVEELIERSTESFRRTLTDLLDGVEAGDLQPELDPEVVGRRAATTVTAGRAWSALAGPFTDSAGAAAALGGISKQAVSQRVASGSILGLRLAATGNGRDRLVYPTWQFHPVVLAHLPQVLRAAGWDPDRAVTGWTIAAWITTPATDADGLAPIEQLRAGRPEPVLAAAAQVADSLGTAERAEHARRHAARPGRAA